MFKIATNNQVYLSKGQSAVYIRSMRVNDKYMSPYIMPKGLLNPKIRFAIKSNKNDSKYVLEYEGSVGSEIHRFSSKLIEDITDYPTTNIKNVLYRIKDNSSGEYNYQYYNGSYTNGIATDTYNADKWTNYDFIIRIAISSSDTEKLRPATYYYDISLVDISGEDVVYKDVFLKPTEFVIGGSL